MDASNANTNQAAKSSRRSRWRRCQDDIADPRARSACMCSPRRPLPTGTAHRRSACSLSMHVLTTAPFPHRYCTSPIRVLARLSRRLTVTGSGEKTLSEARRGPRGGSQSWFAVGVASRWTAVPAGPACSRCPRFRLWLKASRKITIPFRGLRRQTHPPSHPPYAGDETGARTSNTRTRNAAARARRDRAAAADFPSPVRFLKRASRQPYLRSHIWIHSVVVDSSCLAKPLL